MQDLENDTHGYNHISWQITTLFEYSSKYIFIIIILFAHEQNTETYTYTYAYEVGRTTRQYIQTALTVALNKQTHIRIKYNKS